MAVLLVGRISVLQERKRVIVFGTERLAKKWAETNGVDPKDVYLATQPDRIQGLWGPFQLVRYSKDVWVPPTSACERRVRETEGWIKQEKGLRELDEKNKKRAMKS
jgi:hypothetical protein